MERRGRCGHAGRLGPGHGGGRRGLARLGLLLRHRRDPRPTIDSHVTALVNRRPMAEEWSGLERGTLNDYCHHGTTAAAHYIHLVSVQILMLIQCIFRFLGYHTSSLTPAASSLHTSESLPPRPCSLRDCYCFSLRRRLLENELCTYRQLAPDPHESGSNPLTKARWPPTTGRARKPSARPFVVSYQSPNGCDAWPSDTNLRTELMKRSRTSVDVTIAEVQISQSDIVRDVDQHSVLDRCATGRRTSLRVGVAVARRHESAVGTESLHGATHRVSRGTPYVSASRQCKHGGEYAVYVLACDLYHAVSVAIQTSASARHACEEWD